MLFLLSNSPIVRAPRGSSLASFDAVALILLALVLASQGLYLLNEGTFWDSAAYFHAHETGNYPALKKLFDQSGSPLSYYIHRAVGLFPAPILMYRILYLVTQLLTAYVLYRLLVRLNIPRLVALIGGALSIVMPFSIISFELSLLPASVFILCFVAGLERLLAAVQSPAPRKPQYYGALMLLGVSFFHGTCLFLAIVAVFASVIPFAGPRSLRQSALARLRTWRVAHALPFAFIVVKRLFFAPYGRYENYNRISWLSAEQMMGWLRVPEAYGRRLYEVLSAGSHDSGAPSSAWGTLVLVVVVAAAWLISVRSKPLVFSLEEVKRWSTRGRLIALVAALGVVYATILPHFLVGRTGVQFAGFISRDNMPVSLPIAAVLAVGLFCVPRIGRVSVLLSALMILRLSLFQLELARSWLHEDLKLKMLASLLQDEENIRNADIVLYEDSTTRFDHLEWLEFQHVLWQAFGDETRIAFNTFELGRQRSLQASVEAFTPVPGDPLHALANAREARGCGNVVKVEVTPRISMRPTWQEYSAARSGKEALRELAKRRMRVTTARLEPVPCGDPTPTHPMR